MMICVGGVRLAVLQEKHPVIIRAETAQITRENKRRVS